MLLDRVKSFLIKYNLQDKTIAVGFSGGFDSMCLLDILSKIKDCSGFEYMNVIAAHFNHNWRGAESLQEQEVCRIFAASRGIRFVIKTAPDDLKKNENDARLARYDFFEEVLENYDADAFFTAHNKDDNAETVLYRVIKGTGVFGLKGISEKRNCFYRPLLKTNRAEILDYCEKNNLVPNNDSSNADTKYRRNFIRINVIPLLEKINPQIKDALNNLAEVAKNDNEIIEEYLTSIEENLYDKERIVSGYYKTLSNAVKKRIIHNFVQKIGLDYDMKKINELFDFIEKNLDKRNGGTLSIATAKWLYVDEKFIEVIPRDNTIVSSLSDKEFYIHSEGEHNIGSHKLILKKYDKQTLLSFPPSTSNYAYVDLTKIKMPLTIRTRREGDVINPFGMAGTMKLKKFLNSKGVSRHKRDEILLLCNNEEVLWVIGIGLSNKIAVTDNPTHIIEVL